MGRKCKRVEIGASELRARPGLAWVSREVFILNSANMHFCPGVPCTVAGREESRLSKCRNESGLCSKKIRVSSLWNSRMYSVVMESWLC